MRFAFAALPSIGATYVRSRRTQRKALSGVCSSDLESLTLPTSRAVALACIVATSVAKCHGDRTPESIECGVDPDEAELLHCKQGHAPVMSRLPSDRYRTILRSYASTNDQCLSYDQQTPTRSTSIHEG